MRERSTAMGIINAGTAVGAVIAPPGIALVIATLNWRWVFFLSGAVGLLWTLWWRRAYYASPAGRRARRDRHADRAACRGCIPGSPVLLPGLGPGLRKFLSDAAWYFYMGWLAKYLYDVRGFDTKQRRLLRLDSLRRLRRRQPLGRLVLQPASSAPAIRLNAARKVALGASAAVMPFIFFVTRSPVELAIVLFSMAFFGQQSWSTLVMTLPADMFPRNAVGSVAGLVGLGGAIGGAVFNLVVGYMLDHSMGYSAVFAMLSTFHVLAF